MEQRFGPVSLIPGDNSGNYPNCNSLYVEAGTKLLIDPASNRDRLRQIRDSLGVDVVLLSHWHEDHLMHLDLFDDKPLWMSAADAEPLRGLEAFFDAYNMTEEERVPWRITMSETFHFKPRVPHLLIENGKVVDLGGVTVEVVHTPGHTPGHLALLFREAEILFLGDYDLTSFGPWYGDTHSDIDELLASVEKLKTIPARTWLASHGEGVFLNDPGELWDAYVSVVHQREEKLMDLLAEPRTMADVIEARIVYKKKREPKEFFDFGERSIMGKHLQRLIRKGEVTFDGEVYRPA
ncbi:MAG: MBL fold metallo-hydrolase [Desulfomonile sp.]|nr:MBL fold metallo-hydrolase [Desulfomonile sp.]